eukprot:TRINITY_DN9963_c0_g1_i1.p1 TRINITY_DN9963_c0_g1~~TRINITY_DN9963_c0_g1_i1.p1  ORF type:complete len:239 (+),score=50.80 TRINITY_DN9963_c0_g1_i1:22-717(+)
MSDIFSLSLGQYLGRMMDPPIYFDGNTPDAFGRSCSLLDVRLVDIIHRGLSNCFSSKVNKKHTTQLRKQMLTEEGISRELLTLIFKKEILEGESLQNNLIGPDQLLALLTEKSEHKYENKIKSITTSSDNILEQRVVRLEEQVSDLQKYVNKGEHVERSNEESSEVITELQICINKGDNSSESSSMGGSDSKKICGTNISESSSPEKPNKKRRRNEENDGESMKRVKRRKS